MSEIAQLYRSESYSQRVAAEVRGHAARQGIMQKELARILGMHPSQITARIRGRTAFTLDELAVLAKVFGIQPADLMPECTVRDSNPEPALFLSAFAALADPTSRAYYDRKRAAGKRHNAALICLARRRVDVIYAMLRDRRPYQAPAAPTPPSDALAA